MLKTTGSFLLCFLFVLYGKAQKTNIINVQDVSRIEKALSADDMEGRAVFTKGIEKAADFIAEEFKKAGLSYWDGLTDYRQHFAMVVTDSLNISATVDGRPIAPEKVIALGSEANLHVDQSGNFQQVFIDSTGTIFDDIMTVMRADTPTVLWLSDKYSAVFKRLGYFARQPRLQGSAPIIIVLHNQPETFSLDIRRMATNKPLTNILGVLPGKSRKNEYVVFSAHYDHLGIGKPDARGDSIYNGANDDASGTTAVIMLANYFKALKNNERTLIFVAFTAEEIGGFGSRYFSQQLDPEKVVAMFNIEMIGTDSKWGANSAYITGFEKSDFGVILQKNLEGSKFHFEPDPYPKQQLFYRSDNATLAALGVPAHTISTSKMDNEPHYHKQSDEYETLDMVNMTEVIRAIALSSRSIVSGTDTPSRVAKER